MVSAAKKKIKSAYSENSANGHMAGGLLGDLHSKYWVLSLKSRDSAIDSALPAKNVSGHQRKMAKSVLNH